MNKEKLEQYTILPEFQEFLTREFDKTAAHATAEELAEFAFGSLEKAIEAFKTSCRRENES